MARARLDCADAWIQASAATTDYVHTCGFLGNVIDMPLPVPDGEGAIGLRDGSFDNGNFKEYAGACLIQNISAGKTYRLRLNVGFRDATTSPPFNISIFGHPSCDALPFGNGNNSIGCPTNVTGWEELGQVSVSGIDEWVEVEINFTTNQDIGAVVIGPDCSQRATGVDRYYFFDNLRLAETIDFGYDVEVMAGSPCLLDLQLGMSGMEAGETYQWYRNGIAIAGANQTTYDVPNDGSREGEYQVFVQANAACQLTKPWSVVIENSIVATRDTLCGNSTYAFGSQMITQSGEYSETFLDRNGCDSMVNLALVFRQEATAMIDTTICSGDSFQIGDEVIDRSGTYSRTIQNQYGCDSMVDLTLNIEEPLATFQYDDIQVALGAEVALDLQGQEANITAYTWSFGETEICSNCSDITFIPLDDGLVTLDVLDKSNCPQEIAFNIFISKEYSIYIPNAFSPNNDGANDVFSIYPNNALAEVKSFRIFDRWGSSVYELLNSFEVQWDGTHQGKKLNVGTYVYSMEAVFIDGHSEILSGTVHLVR